MSVNSDVFFSFLNDPTGRGIVSVGFESGVCVILCSHFAIKKHSFPQVLFLPPPAPELHQSSGTDLLALLGIVCRRSWFCFCY